MKRTLIAAAALAAGVLLLAGCGSSKPSSHSSTMSGMRTSAGAAVGSPASGPHNDQDVSFATDMIPHHGQAVTMADLALTRATNPAVKQLASAIKGAQAPEIAAMSGWLSGWKKPVPPTSMSMHHGGMSMPGMMSDADMVALAKATGSAFDKLWLTQMITHHQGAIAMSRTELTNGQNPEATSLAQSIITGQSNEITQMKQLLPTIP